LKKRQESQNNIMNMAAGAGVVVLQSTRRRSRLKKKRLVNRRLVMKWCGLATREYALQAVCREPGAPLHFQIIRGSFDLAFVIRGRTSM
jgi:hypothetical protein